MASTLTPAEEGQLGQTIEMFEVITQSQPHDYQSLEILKEAYSKLGRSEEALGTSKRIAKAYVEMGQLSSAILEYETILQRCPEDPDVQLALKNIESKATSFPAESPPPDAALMPKPGSANGTPETNGATPPKEAEDGRRMMQKLFVESKLITEADFSDCWRLTDPAQKPGQIPEPFIHTLAERGLMAAEKSLKLISDKSRVAFLPLLTYDLDIDLARSFPAAMCKRWCILPFDRMSKSVFVATANPFNLQAAKELAGATRDRLLWYLVPPVDLLNVVRKVYR
jgi:hypothetical protein